MRDSVNEDYDNRSVIEQIYDIRKRTGDATANSEEALRKANEAIAASQGHGEQIAANTVAINAMDERVTENSKQIGHVKDDITMLNTDIVDINGTDAKQTADITKLQGETASLSNEQLDRFVFHLTADKKLNGELVRGSGESQGTNLLSLPLVKSARTISGVTNRSFKIVLDMWDGSQIITNDMVIPEGGGTSVTVTGITLKAGSQPNTLVASIVLSDGSEVDSNEYPIPGVDAYTKQEMDTKLGGYIRRNDTVNIQEVTGRVDFKLAPFVPEVKEGEKDSFRPIPAKQFYTETAPMVSIVDGTAGAKAVKVQVGDNSSQADLPSGPSWKQITYEEFISLTPKIGDEIMLNIDYPEHYVYFNGIYSNDKLSEKRYYGSGEAFYGSSGHSVVSIYKPTSRPSLRVGVNYVSSGDVGVAPVGLNVPPDAEITVYYKTN